jgi:hypothetical protein
MYNDNFVNVNTGLSLTKAISLAKGVKQGDPMASSLFILCIEPLLRRMSKRMLEIAPSPFPLSPSSNMSTYADDTTPIVSHVDQFLIIEEELKSYAEVSGGRINWGKCELFPFGSWKQIQLPTQYKVVPNGLKILGIFFGDLSHRNWEDLLLKMRAKLSSYKCKSSCTSLSAKVNLLNTFILPIIWYVLKVLDPHSDFLKQVQVLCEEYLWEKKRHWVKRSMTYAPQSNGGLGLKSPQVQILIFRLRALTKAQSPNCSKYFLVKVLSLSNDMLYENRPSPEPNIENLRVYINKMCLSLSTLPSLSAFNRFHLRNETIFGSSGFPVLLSLGVSTAGEVEVLLDSNTIPSIPERRIRKLNAETSCYKVKKRTFINSLKPHVLDPNSKLIYNPEVRARNPISGDLEDLSAQNDYLLCFFGIFPFESFSGEDQKKLRSKKWERLKGTKLSTLEVDIVWRLWNSCLITFKIAKIMGLLSSGNCSFCPQINPNCFHLVHCSSTQSLWNYIWYLLETRMGHVIQKKEKMFGYDNSPLVNTVIFLALVTLYRRFLHCVNSGKSDLDLCKAFKQNLFEKIYVEYIIAKSNKRLSSFSAFWGNGAGIFVFNDQKIDIRL